MNKCTVLQHVTLDNPRDQTFIMQQRFVCGLVRNITFEKCIVA